jgi:MFS family permease
VLGLAIAQVRTRERSAALWAQILLVAASALALAPVDPLPCWTAVGLAVALYTMLGDPEPPPALPLAITAGALLALRYELAPIAAAAVIIAWWRQRDDHHRTAILIGGVFAVGFPFLVARMVAWRSVPALVHTALAAPSPGSLAVHLLLAVAIAVPAVGILGLALPENRTMRSAAIATAVALGALAAHLTGVGPYAARMIWPIAIAFAVVLVIELARTRTSGAAAMICALVLCVLIQDGRDAPGRLRWSRRLANAATAIETVERPPAEATDPYGELIAQVPRGATIAVWVTAPERLDYTQHRLLDLRTPTAAALRRHTKDRGRRLDALLVQLSAEFLLLETDEAHARRAQASALYHWVCAGTIGPCADDLEAIAHDHPELARRGNAVLVDLRR